MCGSVCAYDAALSALTAVAHGKICNCSYLQEWWSTQQILSKHQVVPGDLGNEDLGTSWLLH